MAELNTRQQVINLICNDITVGISTDDVSNETSLIGDLQLDSIQIIELVSRLEGEFAFEIDDEDMDFQHFATINSVAKLVESKRK